MWEPALMSQIVTLILLLKSLSPPMAVVPAYPQGKRQRDSVKVPEFSPGNTNLARFILTCSRNALP